MYTFFIIAPSFVPSICKTTTDLSRASGQNSSRVKSTCMIFQCSLSVARDVMERVNEWIVDHPDMRVFSCEAVPMLPPNGGPVHYESWPSTTLLR